jgi:hypothetical protein
MKRIKILMLAAMIAFPALHAQNVDDALRYSQLFYNGTARFMAMGGAFTALGGDLSTLSQNPAGLGVYRSSELSFSPQLLNINTSANFFNGISSDYLNNFNIGQTGVVLNLIKNNDQTGLVTLNAGYSFNKTGNFNSTTRIQGNNNSSSMADYWVSQSNGFNYTTLEGAAGIAYDAWIMDTITGSGGYYYGTVFSNYGDNPPSVYGQNVRRIITNTGYMGEHAFSIGGNYSNKVFFGATLGINRLQFTGHYEHLERTNVTLASEFNNFTYTNHFENKGTGYAFKMGTIIKPMEYLRIGLAFHAPMVYKIDEYYYDNVNSQFDDGGRYTYSNDPMRYNYALTTPLRVIAGVAVQVQKMALVSAEYEFVDYGSARFSETGDNFDYSEKNMDLKNTLKSTGNLRLGGELRLNKLYLRTGFGYYGKAFSEGEENENLYYTSFSAGAGFREQNLFIDFGFTRNQDSQKYFLYPVSGNTPSAMADISTGRNLFTMTFGFKFGN